METTLATEKLAKQKLEAFEQLQPEFEASFHFVQEVHGQRRFSTFPVMESVHYLHALWICECKDRLLSIYKNIERYDGRYCLDLLRRWQEGDTADVIAFLHTKLDGFPFVELTHQIMDAKTTHPADDGLVRRLIHGRLTLLRLGKLELQVGERLLDRRQVRHLQRALGEMRHRFPSLPQRGHLPS